MAAIMSEPFRETHREYARLHQGSLASLAHLLLYQPFLERAPNGSLLAPEFEQLVEADWRESELLPGRIFLDQQFIVVIGLHHHELGGFKIALLLCWCLVFVPAPSRERAQRGSCVRQQSAGRKPSAAEKGGGGGFGVFPDKSK